jgi:site-specific recombinase XerD
LIGRLFFFGARIKSCIGAQNVGASFGASFEWAEIGRTKQAITNWVPACSIFEQLLFPGCCRLIFIHLKNYSMLPKSFHLLFFLKPSKCKTNSTPTIYLRITIEGARVELSTQRSCEPSKWNPHAGRVHGTREEVRSLNAYLDTLQAKVYNAHRALLASGEPITGQTLKQQIKGVASQPRMILEVFRDHNEKVTQLVGRDFSAATLERYKTSLEHTRHFIEWKYQLQDLDINKLDYSFIADYAHWLKTIRHCNHNSTMKYLGNFKKIVLLCFKNGWLSRDPFAGFKLTRREVERPFLSEEELQAMASKVFPTERLNYVRDIFLFSCFTGLAYADVKKLKRSEITKGIDGEEWIFTCRQKTRTASRIPLLPSCVSILNKYADHPQCARQGQLLPLLSNQKMNAYLKEIAEVCGIQKKLTFHVARHTFATTVTLNNGVPIETVSKMLGHTNLRMTQHYAKLLDKKVSEDMQLLKQKLGKAKGDTASNVG